MCSTTLFLLLKEAEVRSEAAANSKAKLAQIDSIAVECLTLSTMSIKQLFPWVRVSASDIDPSFGLTYEQTIQDLPNQIALLRSMYSDKAQVDEIEAATLSWISELRASRNLIKQGGAYNFIIRDSERKRSFMASLDLLIGKLNELRNRESSLLQVDPDGARRMQDYLKFFIMLTVASNILLSILLAWFFNQKLKKRFGILLDNCERMESGKVLNLPMREGDELAYLDTSLHRANDEMKLRHEEVQSLLQNMFVGLLTLDDSGRILSVNLRLLNMYGYDEDDLIGKKLDILFTGKEKALIADFSKFQSIAVGKVQELSSSTKNKTLLTVDFCLNVYELSGNRMLIANFLDVSERYQFEQIRQRFLSVISHEIKTPITSIRLFLQYLLAGDYGQLSAKGDKRAASAKVNAERINGLIVDLLRLEKMKTGKLDLLVENLVVDSLFREALDSVQEIATLREIAIVCEANSLNVQGDAKWLVQVLVNLLTNALKTSPNGAQVTMSATPENGRVKLSVQDRGMGISEQERELVFEPFFQTQSYIGAGVQEKSEGTGLGLTICRSIVEQLNGEIGVSSNTGQGCTFWFKLPCGTAEMLPEATFIKR